MLNIRHGMGMHHSDRSAFAREVLSSLMVISTVLVCLRIYARFILIKSPGLDDALACVSYVFVIAQGVMELIEVNHGEGRQAPKVSNNDLQLLHVFLPTQILLYFVTIGLVRLSLVACLPRLHQNGMPQDSHSTDDMPNGGQHLEEMELQKLSWFTCLYKTAVSFRRCAIILAAMITIVTIVFTFLFAFQCTPPIQLWRPRPASERRCMAVSTQLPIMITHGAIGVVFDFVLLTLPLFLIYTKMIWSLQALKVMLIFSVGLLAFAMGIVRLVFLVRTDPFINMTYHMVPGTLSAHAEVHVILWVACFHTLPPIFRVLARKTGLRSISTHSASVQKSTSRLFTKMRSSPANKRKTWIPLQTASRVTTHVEATNRMSRVGRGEIELEGQYGKDAIVKSTHIEVHSSPLRGCEAT